ncbi:MAG: hypothetical protein ACRDJ4_07395 [Actinomycetota bacterium]
MSQPFVFIGTHTIKEGKLEDYKRYWARWVETFEEREPQLLSINGYVNEEGTELTVVQVHPDEASMMIHMQVVGKHIAEAYETYLEGTVRIQVYGVVSDSLMAQLKQSAPPGADFDVKPLLIGGLTRLMAEEAAR